MASVPQRHIIYGILLGAVGLSAFIFVSGLSLTLQLGDANQHGFLLLPALPTPLYIIMGLAISLNQIARKLAMSQKRLMGNEIK